jgi:Ca-activated chloride channel family protein
VRDEGNEIVRTRLDETTLMGIAESTGGFYVPLGASGEGLVQVYEAGIKSIPRKEHDSRLEQIPLERFQWPLGFAVLLLVLECLTGTRRRFSGQTSTSLATLMVVALIGASTTVQAEGPPAHLLEETRKLQQAVIENPHDFRSHYNLGTALYRKGRLDDAIKAFQQSLGSDDPDLHARALHNLGNAHFHRGHRALAENRDQAREDWEEALRHYRNALAIAPAQPQTDENQNVVKQWLESLKEDDEPQQDQQEQEEQGQDGDESSPDQSDENQPEDSDPSDSGDSSESNGGDKAEGQNDPQPGEGQPEDAGESGHDPTDKDEDHPTSTIDTTGEDRDDMTSPPMPPDKATQESSPEQPTGEVDSDEPDGMPSPDEAEQSAEERGDNEIDGDAPGETAEEQAENRDARPTATGAMSRDEARQLLDAMLYNERKLPITPEAAGREGGRPRQPQRNW